jgi:glycosyltransferase involved in cell wall biosynthesis
LQQHGSEASASDVDRCSTFGRAAGEPPTVGVVLEQTLGHVTHAANLRELLRADDRIAARLLPVEFAVTGWQRRLPGYGNWTVRAGWRANRAVHRLRRQEPVHALFFHTQVPAVLNPRLITRTPTVVSLDATPIQYDELGEHYAHDTQHQSVEHAKRRLNVACFRRAAAIVTWAEWTKRSLVRDYDVDPQKIHVVPPGVITTRWSSTRPKPAGPVMRVLFVGGNLARKGGDALIAAVRTLRAAGTPIEADLVTQDDEVTDEDGIRIHRGMTPNSEPLIELYGQADVFCLPTLGDCLPMVLSEAGSMGLPLVSTDVGAIEEIVRNGETGLLVPPGDVVALTSALRRLAEDGELRRRLGAGAHRLTAREFDAATNARRIVDILLDVSVHDGEEHRA